jgi:predicted GIY-YIG superfamily endonuclease
LRQHNNEESPYTSQGTPWFLLWSTNPWFLLWSTNKDSYLGAEALEFKIKNLSRCRKLKFIEKYSYGIQDAELLYSLDN